MPAGEAAVERDRARRLRWNDVGDGNSMRAIRRAHDAAPALIDEAQGADLLVVGSKGHGAFTGMLVGSVSLHCVTSASCPVVVVHGKGRPA